MFNVNAAINDALTIFDQFKQELEKAEHASDIPDDLVNSMQKLLMFACNMIPTLSSLVIPDQPKKHVIEILHFFQNDPKAAEKISQLSKIKGWDFAEHFQKLHSLLLRG